MRDKVFSYLGFAARTRNLVTGYNTCIMMMEKRKVKLLILTKDLAENTVKKMLQQCNKSNVEYRIFGSSDELSQITGKTGKGILELPISISRKSFVRRLTAFNQKRRGSNDEKST